MTTSKKTKYPFPSKTQRGALFLTDALFTLLLTFSINAYAASDNVSDKPAAKFALPEEKVKIGDLLRYAYENNPSILAARQGWKATLENYRVATGYPDPQIMVTYFPEPIQTRLGPQDWNASISQIIPFPGKLRTASVLIPTGSRRVWHWLVNLAILVLPELSWREPLGVSWTLNEMMKFVGWVEERNPALNTISRWKVQERKN